MQPDRGRLTQGLGAGLAEGDPLNSVARLMAADPQPAVVTVTDVEVLGWCTVRALAWRGEQRV